VVCKKEAAAVRAVCSSLARKLFYTSKFICARATTAHPAAFSALVFQLGNNAKPTIIL
jgi:hypothetical protein